MNFTRLAKILHASDDKRLARMEARACAAAFKSRRYAPLSMLVTLERYKRDARFGDHARAAEMVAWELLTENFPPPRTSSAEDFLFQHGVWVQQIYWRPSAIVSGPTYCLRALLKEMGFRWGAGQWTRDRLLVDGEIRRLAARLACEI